MRRRTFITLIGGAAAWPFAARAQQPKPARIGVLVLTDADAALLVRELREGLRELGQVEGQNYVLDIRSAQGDADRLGQVAAELVALPVDVIVAAYSPCVQAAKRASARIPIVMAAVADPIGAGIVESLARPGGNVTGFSNMGAETAGKNVELFRDMLGPSLRRVAVIANPLDPFTKSFLEHVELAGRSAGIEIAPVAMVRRSEDIQAAFAEIAREGAQAIVLQAIFFAKSIADLAIENRLPSASVLRSYPLSGGLMSYGADIAHIFRRTAVVVTKLLQGAKPANLPVEQPTKFDLVINLKTANAIGLTVPETFLTRADEVIE